MKKTIRIAVLLLALCLLLGGLSVRGEDAWSEEYYRVIDLTDTLSETEMEDLDGDCIDLMRAHGVDLALMAVTDEVLDGDALQDVAWSFYEDCGFGCGPDRDGYVAVYLADAGSMEIFCFGNAERRLSSDDLRFIADNAPGYEEEYGLWGVLYSVCSYLDSFLEDAQGGSSPDLPEPDRSGGASLPAGQTEAGARGAAGKPDWYPADPQHFPPYHDADAPRVVDTADLFSDAAEARMEARLAELRRELEKDIVVFTDVSSYGLTRDVYAADFYDFNGYGVGPDFEGICLFICMEEGNRGFWSCCTGPVTMALYTEGVANAMDDALYEYMAAAAYTEGVEDWIENVRGLYLKGDPFLPDWYPGLGETLVRYHDADSPRVVDDAGLLTPEQVSSLAARAAAIAEKYGMDVAVHLSDDRAASISRQEYSDAYYAAKGLGYGDGYDGILLSVFQVPGYYGNCRVTAGGAVRDRLTEVDRERMTEKCIDVLGKDQPYEAVRAWLKDVEHLAKTGRVLPKPGYWLAAAVIGLLLGAIVGGIALGIARKKMAAPAEKRTAAGYMLAETLAVRKLEDRYIYTSTSKKYSPVQSRSGGGGGGGGSYSRSYSGSSGSSHSGSGRSF